MGLFRKLFGAKPALTLEISDQDLLGDQAFRDKVDALPLEQQQAYQRAVQDLGQQILTARISSPEEMEQFFAAHPEKAIAYNAELLKVARATGERRVEAIALGELGLAYARSGILPKAATFFEKHLEVARELGEKEWQISDLNNLGKASLELGDKRKAAEFHKQALSVASGMNHLGWIAFESYSLASIYTADGDYGQALLMAQQALRIWTQIGSPSKQRAEKLVGQIKAAMK